MNRRETSAHRMHLRQRSHSQSQHLKIVTQDGKSSKTARGNSHNHALRQQLTGWHHHARRIRFASLLASYRAGLQTRMLELRAPNPAARERRGRYTGSVMSLLRLKSLAIAALLVSFASAAQETALDRYLAQRDAVYGWKWVNTIPAHVYKTF